MKKKVLKGFGAFIGIMIIISVIAALFSPDEEKDDLLPTQAVTVNNPTLIPTTTISEPTKALKKELTNEEVIEIVSRIVTEKLGVVTSGHIDVDETVESVTLENKKLIIAINLTEVPINGFTYADVASNRTSAITDEILRHQELDQYWDSITFDYNGYGDLKNKTLKQSDAVGEGTSRYFDIDFRDFGEESEDEETTKKVEKTTSSIDWESCITDLKKELTDPEFFSYVNDIGAFVNDEDKKITFTATLYDSTDPSVALDFADTFIRRLNAIAMLQDSSIKGSSKDYYGGLYDIYSILIGIAPVSKTDDSKEWFVYDAVAKGLHTKIKLQEQYR